MGLAPSQLKELKKSPYRMDLETREGEPEETSDTLETQAMDSERGTHSYIGETARTLRQRVGEHWTKLNMWSSSSFILRHWMLEHGTLSEPPQFTFKIIKRFSEPMGRQIMEALKILESGSLNLKSEYGANHICSLETSSSEWEKEKSQKIAEKEKKKMQENIKIFSSVMSNVIHCNLNKPVCTSLPNDLNISRSQQSDRKRSWRDQGVKESDSRTQTKKRKMMDASTPLRGAEAAMQADSDLISPILQPGTANVSRTTSVDNTNGSSEMSNIPDPSMRTNLSDPVTAMRIGNGSN